MWVLLLGVAETLLCSFLYFTVGIVQCVYQFTSAVITVIFQAIEQCPVVSLQSIFLFFLTAAHKIDSLQKTLLFVSRKRFSLRPLHCSFYVNIFTMKPSY